MSETEITPGSPWPVQHRAALIVVVHIDAHGPDPDDGDGLALGLDYAVTGLPRLLRICGDLGIEATTSWTARAVASHPQLARAAHEQGHELSWSRASRSAAVGPVIRPDLLAKITGQTTLGHVASLPDGTTEGDERQSPEERTDPPPPWIMTGAGGDTPVIVRGGDSDESSVLIPVSPYWIDATWLHPRHPGPPSFLLEAWSASLASVRTEGGLMTVVLHPHIAGRPGFADAFVRFLDEAIASGDVWIARADHLALWWKSNTDQQS